MRKLARWKNLAPKPVKTAETRKAYVVAVVDAGVVRRRGAVGVRAEAQRGVWNAQTGELIVAEEGTVLVEFVPGRDEVALVREALRKDAGHGGTSRADFRWFFERYSLPDGARKSSLEIDQTGGWPVALSFPAKDKGRIARIRCGDEEYPYSVFVEVSDKGDKRHETAEEKKRKAKAATPSARANSHHTPQEELESLARSSESLAVVVARNPATAVPLLKELAGHPSHVVRAAVARHPALPVELQTKLATDEQVNVRLAAAHHLRGSWYDAVKKRFSDRMYTDQKIMTLLARDKDASVRAAAARGSKDPATLTRLARDPDLSVRKAVVKWELPAEVERILAADPSSQVRLMLCETRHPKKCGRAESIDAKALELLRKDENERVRAAAALLKPFGKRRLP